MDDTLWGMPLEVAVAVIGLGGVLIGAAIAGVASFLVAKWQSDRQLAQARHEKLDEAVAQLHLRTMALAREVMDARQAPSPHYPPVAAVWDDAGIVVARSREAAPHLHDLVSGLMERLTVAVPKPWHVAGERQRASRSRIVKGPTPAEHADASVEVSSLLFAIGGVTARWMRNPEKFDSDRAFTIGKALAYALDWTPEDQVIGRPGSAADRASPS